MFGHSLGNHMNQKALTGDCINCESTFELNFYKEYVSTDQPQFCPFCGEIVEEFTDDYIEEEYDEEEESEWDN